MLKLQSISISHSHDYSSLKQDPLIVVGEENGTSDEKKVKKPNSTLGRNGCNPTSETPAGGSSTSSSFSFQGHWLEEDKVFPLKKRRMILERGPGNATAEKTESKKVNATAIERKHANWKWVDESDDNDDDGDYEWGAEIDGTLEINKPMVRDGSRCKRTDGRGWRCSKPPIEGHSMCENHLHKTRAANRLRTMKMHSSKGSINFQESNHKLKTRDEIEPPFPQPDIKSCYSSPKSKRSSLSFRARQRCRRWNGRAWRCSETALEGHSLCEHHLIGNRLRKKGRNVPRQAAASSTAKSVKMTVLNTDCNSDNEDNDVEFEKGRMLPKNKNVSLVKDRSMSSLLGQKSSSSSRLYHL